MRTPTRSRALAAIVATAWLLAGCSMLTPLPPGARQWSITVENRSGQPAQLVVAADRSPIGEAVGTAVPAIVPPGTSQKVVFTVPSGRDWAIFVNAGPDRGPLILAQDVPADASGELPLRIFIGSNGDPSVSGPAEPGWFGN